jgi:DNA-binding response OmpR family regulator
MNSAAPRENPHHSASGDLLKCIDGTRAVAIMEDEDAIFDALKAHLEPCGFLVLRANSVDACVELARGNCEAFILDIAMGLGRDDEGILALKALKAIKPTIYCAMLTSHQSDRFRPLAEQLGCDVFLGKSSKDLADAEHVLLALDRMLLSRATNLPLGAQSRPSAAEICYRIELTRSFPESLSQSDLDAMVKRYLDLRQKDVSGLAPHETVELRFLEATLGNIRSGLLIEHPQGSASEKTWVLFDRTGAFSLKSDDRGMINVRDVVNQIALLQMALEANLPHLRLYRWGAAGLLMSIVSLAAWKLTGLGIPFHPFFACCGCITSLGTMVMAFLVKARSTRGSVSSD